MNYYERHLGDYARDTGHLSLTEHGAYTLLLDRYYATEQPIPAAQAHRFARARAKDEIKAVDAVLSEFFRLEGDVWVHNRVDREIARFINAKPAADAKKDNERERQRRARERRKSLFDELRGHGVTAPWDVTTEWLQTELHRVTSAPVTPPVTRDNTANQTPDPRHQTPEDKHAPEIDNGSGPVGPARASPAGVVCLAIRGQGVADANPSHPELLALIAAGAGVDVFIEAAAHAATKHKGFAYVLGTVKGRMADAEKTAAIALSKPQSRAAQAVSFAQQDEQARRSRWEEMTGQKWPGSAPAGECFDAENVTPINPKRISA